MIFAEIVGENFVQKLQIMIPEMLQENGLLNKGAKSDIPFHFARPRGCSINQPPRARDVYGSPGRGGG